MARAVVIGGSIAGMSAARALSDAFHEVVIIDRDHFPPSVEHRSGVPQSRHAHVLLDRGKLELEALFPGFTSEMRAGGAEVFDPGVSLALLRAPHWQDVGPVGVELIWASRNLFEFSIRKLLAAQTSVRLLEGKQVVGLSVSAGPLRRVAGVKLRDGSGQVTELAADLVVDASGRHTRADLWFREHGLPLPARDRVDAHLGYASRFYRPPARRPSSWRWRSLWIDWEPPTLARYGLILPVERDGWLVTLVGIGDDMPPSDEAGFTAFLRTLSAPALADALELATPLSDVATYRSLANVFRRYDRWPARLRGFLALGDAACAFNPIYGQGMSVAAACASLLRAHLREVSPHEPEFERLFFRRQASFVRGAWRLATRADFAWPTTEGERPPSLPLLDAYMRLAMKSIHHDAALRRRVFPVFNLTGPGTLFFKPRFMADVLVASAQRHLRERLHVAYRHARTYSAELLVKLVG